MTIRRLLLASVATAVLGTVNATTAHAKFVVDPICAAECGDDTCATPPQKFFKNCTEACNEKWEICPVLAHCYVKCDESRDDYASRCGQQQQSCIRNRCRIRVSARRIAPALRSPCEQRCFDEKPACRGQVMRAMRHCRANCADGCGGFQFKGALTQCKRVCKDKYTVDSACENQLDTCVDRCGTPGGTEE